MVQQSNGNQVTESLVNKLLKGQQLQQLQLDDLQKQLLEIQVKLQPLTGISDQLRQLNSIPIQMQQLLHMQKQLRKYVVLTGSATTESATEEDIPSEPSSPIPTKQSLTISLSNSASYSPSSSHSENRERTTINSVNGRMIPWPRTQEGKRKVKLSRSLITKEMVVNVIQHHLLRQTNIDFVMEGVSTGNSMDRSRYIYKRLAEAANMICSNESQLHQASYYDTLPNETKTSLNKRLEKKSMEDKIPLGRAEDQWLAQYFISCYFRNRRTRSLTIERRTIERQKTQAQRKRQRVTAPAEMTTIRSTPLPSTEKSTSTSALVKKAKTRRSPVVISEDQDDVDCPVTETPLNITDD